MSDDSNKPDYGLLMQILRNHRDAIDVDAFEEKRNHAIEGLRGDTSASAHMYRSRISYEEGMLRVALEEDELAARCFGDSGEHALLANDSLRWNVGKFRSTITEYFADILSANETYTSLMDTYAKRPKRQDVLEQDHGFLENSDLNFLKRLNEISFDAGATDAQTRAEEYMEHPIIVQGVADGVPMYLLVKCQTEARLLMLDEGYDQAVNILSSYLDVDVANSTIPSWVGEDLSALKEHANKEAMEICRDYRDLGRALLQSSRANKLNLAIHVFEKGLLLPANKGNKRFLRQIRDDLSRLAQSS
ncbi:MAG: hypothetical protein HRT80_04535 [Henriciella sp.]|nr:hypothetical protein [Henriciella sp.]